MSKKKKSSIRPGVFSAAQIKNNALARFERACELMIGPGHFHKFSDLCRARLLAHRFPAVKLKFKPGIAPKRNSLKYYQEIFSSQLNSLTFTTIQEIEMPVSLYLREGLGLLIYTGAMKQESMPHIQVLEKLFGQYNTDEWLRKPVAEVVFLLHKMSILLTDWSSSVFVYSVAGLAALDSMANDNSAVAELIKPESCNVKFDGINREVVRLCWSETDGNIEYVKLSPISIGYRSYKPEQLFDVYIQGHALQRLEERLGLIPGVVHHAILEMLKRNELTWFRQGPSVLVRFSLWERKLGYLVCSLVEEKIVIRSFLFLTNDGTPEGKKLSELTQLERLDKKYLGIDSLSGFLGLKIQEDEGLVALFTEAGCADLLDLSEIQMYHLDEIRERDPEKLLSYMMGLGSKTEELVEG
ncbi:hypothetical protein [Pedobacter sp. GR22-6]|uniref:hypothetical protein n=1 Tax=Pedobacter sp. GR22-6 TaxID=3127957 RepID=UPI00307CDB52